MAKINIYFYSIFIKSCQIFIQENIWITLLMIADLFEWSDKMITLLLKVYKKWIWICYEEE